jgi:DNA-directed RNA polymerase subunit delta
LSLKQYSKEQLQEMSLIELAYESLVGKDKQAVPFQDILDEIVAAVNLSENQVKSRIAQFYTDLNIDGRFLCLGDNRWGIRDWYPVEQSEEDTITPIKPKKKKAKKAVDEDDLEIEDYDELDEDLEYEDLDEFVEEDDDDDLLEDDDDLLEDEEELLVEGVIEDEEIIEDEEEFEELDEEDDPEEVDEVDEEEKR